MGLFDEIGSFLGTNKSDEAIAAQSAGAAQATQTLKEIYDQQRADQQPYMQAGYKALEGMQDPNYTKSFTMADFQADPGYAFRMQQGQQALERSAAAKGGVMNGGVLKAITDYGQNMGSQEYTNAYNRFYNDKNQAFSKLSTIAGMGQGATNAMTNAAGQYGQSVANTQVGLGNANAAAIIGDANRNANMIGQGASAIAFCDERLKTDIEPVSKEDLDELKKSLRAYKWRYKDPEHFGKGDYIGVMAQDLEKSKLGRTLVFEDNHGNKCVDLHRAMMLFLATMAEA